MIVKIKLITEFGSFVSIPIDINGEDQYQKLLEASKNYYLGGYEMFTENGHFIASPDIVKKSILLIEKYGKEP